MTMTNTESDVVWQQRRYDSGLYDCRVVRRGEAGVLTVTLDGRFPHVLHEETVKLDRRDVAGWQTRCVAVINNPDLRSRTR